MTDLKLKQRNAKYDHTRFIVKKVEGYHTIWKVYIKGHWLRSWLGFQISCSGNTEEVVKKFITSYYGEEWGILNVKDDPEYFV